MGLASLAAYAWSLASLVWETGCSLDAVVGIFFVVYALVEMLQIMQSLWQNLTHQGLNWWRFWSASYVMEFKMLLNIVFAFCAPLIAGHMLPQDTDERVKVALCAIVAAVKAIRG